MEPGRDKKRITVATKGDVGGYSRMGQDTSAIKRNDTMTLELTRNDYERQVAPHEFIAQGERIRRFPSPSREISGEVY